MALIDAHCHLDLYQDPEAVTAEAVRRGVYIISMTTTPTAYKGTKALARGGGRVRTALGLHPELAAEREHELELFEALLPDTDYVGEVGIDGSPAHRETVDLQGRILQRIFDMCAAAGGRTISLHSRAAAGLVLDIIEQEPLAGRFILHWFSGTRAQMERAIGLGCWFSVGPAMLRSRNGRELAAALPRSRVLPESDGPFGTNGVDPLWPWEASSVAETLAPLWGISELETQEFFVGNFRELGATTAAAQ